MDPDELAAQAFLSEHEFVSSVIKMYREFQMQAVGFTFLIYTAVLGLVGSALDSPRLLDAAANVTALLSFLVVVLVLAFAVMEIRIRRASLYISRTLSPKLQALVQQPPDRRLLQWETAPGVHLSPPERWLSHSAVFIVLIAAPSLAAAGWHLWSGVIPPQQQHPPVTITGAVMLLVSSLVATGISMRHEVRKRKADPAPALSNPG
jgi:uncharacterized membrane protein